jgi:hypothetical protein
MQWPKPFEAIPWLASCPGRLIDALLRPRTPSVFSSEARRSPRWSYEHLYTRYTKTAYGWLVTVLLETMVHTCHKLRELLRMKTGRTQIRGLDFPSHHLQRRVAGYPLRGRPERSFDRRIRCRNRTACWQCRCGSLEAPGRMNRCEELHSLVQAYIKDEVPGVTTSNGACSVQFYKTKQLKQCIRASCQQHFYAACVCI